MCMYSGLRGGELSDLGIVGCDAAYLVGWCRRFGEVRRLHLHVSPVKRGFLFLLGIVHLLCCTFLYGQVSVQLATDSSVLS